MIFKVLKGVKMKKKFFLNEKSFRPVKFHIYFEQTIFFMYLHLKLSDYPILIILKNKLYEKEVR